MNYKTQDEVVRECANMVVACWQHYANTPIDGDELMLPKIILALQGILPEKISTGDWFKVALERERCLGWESECDEGCDGCVHFSECAVMPER